MHRLLPVAAALLCLVCARGQTPPPLLAQPPEVSVQLSVEQTKKFTISTPTPAYPIEARRRHLTGKGVFQLNIDLQTGDVVSVDVLTSTGHTMLDDAAIKTLKTWKFRPYGMIGAKVPIEFSMPGHHSGKNTMNGAPEEPIVRAGLTKQYALYRPQPKYPYEARAKHITGSGICVLELRSDGTVERAYMVVSTGHAILDKAALDGFRQWRFVPGVARKVKIPIRYSMPKPGQYG